MASTLLSLPPVPLCSPHSLDLTSCMASVLFRDELLLLRQSISIIAAPLLICLSRSFLSAACQEVPLLGMRDKLHQGQLGVAAKKYAPVAVVTAWGIHLSPFLQALRL